MTEDSAVVDAFNALGDQITASLPEELALSIFMTIDFEKKVLNVKPRARLKNEDFSKVAAAIRCLGGEYFNIPQNEHFELKLPKKQEKPAAAAKKEDKPQVPEKQTKSVPQVEQPSPEAPSPAPQVPPEQTKLSQEEPKQQPAQDAPQRDPKPKPKMPSPPALFVAINCACCESLDICKKDSSGQAVCLEVLKLNAVQDLVSEFRGLNQNLVKLIDLQKQIPQHTHSANEVYMSQDSQKPTSIPVQRSTRPTEGHQEDGIVWIYDYNQSQERYEKALKKDNEHSRQFWDLRRCIQDKMDGGKKGLEENGFWHWISKEGDFIGRKPAKQWPKRS